MQMQIQKRLDLIVTKKSKCEDIHGVTHLQYVVYLSGNSSTYIQISPDFPRITQKANKQVNTSVRSVEKF